MEGRYTRVHTCMYTNASTCTTNYYKDVIVLIPLEQVRNIKQSSSSVCFKARDCVVVPKAKHFNFRDVAAQDAVDFYFN